MPAGYRGGPGWATQGGRAEHPGGDYDAGMRSHRTRPGPARPGRVLTGPMAALVAAAALTAALVGVGPGAAAASTAQAGGAGRDQPPGALVLVERMGTDEALAAVGGRVGAAGFVSTLPVHQPLASRVLSLAAGRRVDAMDALEGDPAGASGLPAPATVERIRADNPGARFGRLPPTRVLASPGLEAAGLFALGPTGPPRAAEPLPPGDQPIPLLPGRLLVLAVPDAPALAALAGRLQPGDGAGPIAVLGLRAAPGRANAAPFLLLDQPPGRGLVTSDSTRRLGLVALEDVRPTVGGGTSAGDDGTVMRVVAGDDPAAAVTRIDRRVAALVVARTWAIPLLCLAAVLALFALLAVWRGRGSAAVARSLLALTLALPPGYLVASMAEPLAARAWQALAPGALRAPGVPVPWAVAWIAAGLAVAAALTALALRLDGPGYRAAAGAPPARARRSRRGPAAGPRWGSVAEPEAQLPAPSTGAAATPPAGVRERGIAAPALLGGVLLGLVVADLVLGGHGLAQPLLGGSAWDGERFYGLGNGYFAFALAAAMLVIGFGPLGAVAAAGLLAGLGVVDGLPRLGADVGGALTSMLTAGAALVVLAPERWLAARSSGGPRGRRAVLLAGVAVAAVAAAVVVALGAGIGGPVTHAGRFAERLQQGPADAAGVVVDQLARNLRLLANSPFAWVGPLQVAAAALIALRPPPPLRDLPGWVRRVLGLGAFGSALLILLNDTGVTATAASGLFLLAMPAWAWLEGRRRPGPPPPLAGAFDPPLQVDPSVGDPRR
jgi:hypothetical protein